MIGAFTGIAGIVTDVTGLIGEADARCGHGSVRDCGKVIIVITTISVKAGSACVSFVIPVDRRRAVLGIYRDSLFLFFLSVNVSSARSIPVVNDRITGYGNVHLQAVGTVCQLDMRVIVFVIGVTGRLTVILLHHRGAEIIAALFHADRAGRIVVFMRAAEHTLIVVGSRKRDIILAGLDKR